MLISIRLIIPQATKLQRVLCFWLVRLPIISPIRHQIMGCRLISTSIFHPISWTLWEIVNINKTWIDFQRNWSRGSLFWEVDFVKKSQNYTCRLNSASIFHPISYFGELLISIKAWIVRERLCKKLHNLYACRLNRASIFNLFSFIIWGIINNNKSLDGIDFHRNWLRGTPFSEGWFSKKNHKIMLVTWIAPPFSIRFPSYFGELLITIKPWIGLIFREIGQGGPVFREVDFVKKLQNYACRLNSPSLFWSDFLHISF